MWDPSIDMDQLVDDYCKKAYGPASDSIGRFYNILQDKMDGLRYVNGSAVEIPGLLTPEVIAQCNKLMAEAEAHLDKMDAGTRWRTNLVIQSWSASAKFAEAVNLFTTGNHPRQRERICKLVDEVEKFSKNNSGAMGV